MAIDFTVVSEAARLADRWHTAEAGLLRLTDKRFDLWVIPTPDGADIVSCPWASVGPRTRVAFMS